MASSKLKLSEKKFNSKLSMLLATGLAAIASAAPPAAEAGSLNWKFKYSNQLEADVTVQANGINPLIPGNTYSITSISGTIGAVAGVCGTGCFPITGLSNFYGETNTFQYNPTLNPNDPNAFFTDLAGIGFTTSETANWSLYWSLAFPDFGPADSYFTDSATTTPQDGSIIGAGPQAPVPTPGPVPIFGASAAFGMSRRLRRRVLTSRLR